MVPNSLNAEDQQCLVAGKASRLSARLENVLETMGAAGKGLHEKTSSIVLLLPDPLVRRLRYIASVRNKLVHESAAFTERDFELFEAAANEALDELKSLADVSTKRAALSIPSMAIRDHTEIRVLVWFFWLLLLGIGVWVVFMVFKSDLERNSRVNTIATQSGSSSLRALSSSLIRESHTEGPDPS